ncbi:hypothetical protein [Burkholderia gladioli]|uniref:hypothetical protein n=1 Tax=Burkholderia gladioli TaxID=28095 RepID=UPI00163FFEAA|nr:hypothetical protein [Burkholderia gladioli]
MTIRNGYTPEGLYDFSIEPDEAMKAMFGKPIEVFIEMLEAILVMLAMEAQRRTIAMQAEQIRRHQMQATAMLARMRRLEAQGVATVPREEPSRDINGQRIERPQSRRKFSMADVRAGRGPRIDPVERATEPRDPSARIAIPSRRNLGDRLDARSTTARFEPTSRASTMAYDQDNGVEAYRPRSRFSAR